MLSVSSEIERYVVIQPQYADVLKVYGAVRQYQQEIMARSSAPLPQVDPQVARRRWLAGQHVLTGETIAVEEDLFQSLAVDLLEQLPTGWDLRREAEHLLASHLLDAQPDWLADRFISNRQRCLEELAEATGVSIPAIAYVLQTTLGPFYERAAGPLRAHITENIWNKGACPICGSPPIMAKLTLAGGQCRLGCGMCQTEWTFPRARCPFCGESNPHHLRQFHTDDDLGHRVDVCLTCQAYIKTADERELKRVVLLAVEDLVTVHLDVLAREEGYQ